MQKILSALFAATLLCSSGTILAAGGNNAGADRTKDVDGTTGVVTGDQGVVSPTDTTSGVGTTGLDQETRASQNTQEGVNTGTRQIPDDKHKSH